MSSGMAVNVGEQRWAYAPGNRKPRRVSAPVHPESFADAARQADVERLLR